MKNVIQLSETDLREAVVEYMKKRRGLEIGLGDVDFIHDANSQDGTIALVDAPRETEKSVAQDILGGEGGVVGRGQALSDGAADGTGRRRPRG